ncbi:MAG: endopeptidase La [Candidatus Sumerlaeota bacterium]
MSEDKDKELEENTPGEETGESRKSGNIEMSEMSDGSIVMRQGDMEIPEEVPVIALDSLVMFPFMIAPVVMSGESEAQLVHEALQGDRLVGAFLKKEEDGPDNFDNIHDSGALAVVLKMLRMPDGGMRLLLHGLERITITEPIREEPYMKARIEPLKGETEVTRPVEAMVRQVRQQMQRVVEIGQLPDDLASAIQSIDDPGRLADLAVSHLSVKNLERQKVLETVDVEPRLELVLEILGRELDLLELGSEIQTKVSSSMDKNQRQYMLREQLKAIKKELGEDGENAELAELREKIEEARLPDYAQETADKELKRLEMTNPASPEYTVSRNYLDWILSLPWSKESKGEIDMKEAQKILNEDHYALEDVKDRVLEHLAVIKLKQQVRGPILCFVGPPGVGKTSMGKSIARAMGREFHRFSLGGMRDEAEIRGHRRTYIGSMPGRILKALKTAGTRNPLVMLDEIDKLGSDFRGDPASALLEVLDPEQNDTFTDHYLDMPFDLSSVMFITTANVLDTIPRPLLDRMEVLKLSGYTTNEKLQIAKRYLVPRAYEATGVSEDNVEFKDEGLLEIAENYTREAGVRNLEREIGTICRRVAKQLVFGDEDKVSVTREKVREILGPKKVHREMADRTGMPGVATGLAWTQTGGEILFVEASAVRGSGKLNLTGQLGDVMKESAMAAMNVLHSNVDRLGISDDVFSKQDFHVHVPAGATPKDGPSAGITLACAVCSLVLDTPVKDKLAMTGEITLKGNVLIVGGIKEKVLAAHRAGIKEIVLPADCEPELRKDVPEEVQKSIVFYFVENISEVLAIAFPAHADRLRGVDASAALTPEKAEAEQITAEARNRRAPIVLLPSEKAGEPDEPRPPLIIEPGEPRQKKSSPRRPRRGKRQDSDRGRPSARDQKPEKKEAESEKVQEESKQELQQDSSEQDSSKGRSSSRRRCGRRGGRGRRKTSQGNEQQQDQKQDQQEDQEKDQNQHQRGPTPEQRAEQSRRDKERHEREMKRKREEERKKQEQKQKERKEDKKEEKKEEKRIDRGGVKEEEMKIPGKVKEDVGGSGKEPSKDNQSKPESSEKKEVPKQEKPKKKTTRKKTSKKKTTSKKTSTKKSAAKKTTKKKTTKKKTAKKKTTKKKTSKKSTTKKKSTAKKTSKKKSGKESEESS